MRGMCHSFLPNAVLTHEAKTMKNSLADLQNWTLTNRRAT